MTPDPARSTLKEQHRDMECWFQDEERNSRFDGLLSLAASLRMAHRQTKSSARAWCIRLEDREFSLKQIYAPSYGDLEWLRERLIITAAQLIF